MYTIKKAVPKITSCSSYGKTKAYTWDFTIVFSQSDYEKQPFSVRIPFNNTKQIPVYSQTWQRYG